MDKKYDLTDKKTLLNAMEVLCMTNPLFAMGKAVIDKVFPTDRAKVQKETAEKLISAGRDSGVDEMEIVIENTTGCKVNVPYDDVKIDTTIGTDDKMHIKVKYK